MRNDQPIYVLSYVNASEIYVNDIYSTLVYFISIENVGLLYHNKAIAYYYYYYYYLFISRHQRQA